MALILRELAFYYKKLMNEGDERVQDWFMLKSPWPTITLALLYLYVILDIGPKYMKDRKPFNIDKLLIAYNAIQIVACGYIVIEGVRVGLSKYSAKCAPVDYSNSQDALGIAKVIWFYYIVKLSDLLDTVFFVMRKKTNQITFLHVYHHGGMILLSYVFARFYPGGMTTYIVVLNSFVHVVMYTYYLLTAYNKELRQSVWWKKHITQLQLLQFGILLVQHVQLIFRPTCDYPRWIIYMIYIPQNLNMFVLFGDFYYKAYIKSYQVKAD